MDAFTGTTRLILLGFFCLAHYLYTLFGCTSQFEVATFNDPLMGNARNLVWFQSFVVLELCFQLPFFFVAVHYLRQTDLTVYPDSFRAACIAYGAHTSTTLVPILTCFWSPEHPASTLERILLTSLYFPYLAILCGCCGRRRPRPVTMQAIQGPRNHSNESSE